MKQRVGWSTNKHTDWIFFCFDAYENYCGDVIYNPYNIPLNQSVCMNKAVVTNHINSINENSRISNTFSYVKCFNINDNTVFCISYEDWLNKTGNFKLFEPKEREVTIDEW